MALSSASPSDGAPAASDAERRACIAARRAPQPIYMLWGTAHDDQSIVNAKRVDALIGPHVSGWAAAQLKRTHGGGIAAMFAQRGVKRTAEAPLGAGEGDADRGGDGGCGGCGAPAAAPAVAVVVSPTAASGAAVMALPSTALAPAATVPAADDDMVEVVPTPPRGASAPLNKAARVAAARSPAARGAPAAAGPSKITSFFNKAPAQ